MQQNQPLMVTVPRVSDAGAMLAALLALALPGSAAAQDHAAAAQDHAPADHGAA